MTGRNDVDTLDDYIVALKTKDLPAWRHQYAVIFALIRFWKKKPDLLALIRSVHGTDYLQIDSLKCLTHSGYCLGNHNLDASGNVYSMVAKFPEGRIPFWFVIPSEIKHESALAGLQQGVLPVLDVTACEGFMRESGSVWSVDYASPDTGSFITFQRIIQTQKSWLEPLFQKYPSGELPARPDAEQVRHFKNFECQERSDAPKPPFLINPSNRLTNG